MVRWFYTDTFLAFQNYTHPLLDLVIRNLLIKTVEWCFCPYNITQFLLNANQKEKKKRTQSNLFLKNIIFLLYNNIQYSFS